MPITKTLNAKSNVKQLSNSDLPVSPYQYITSRYEVDSTEGQTVIALNFAVDQAAKQCFILTVDGKVLREGASNDYTFTSIAANNTSSEVTLTQPLTADLNVQAILMGTLIQREPNILSLQAQLSQLASTAGTGSGSKNYITYTNFEAGNTTGWGLLTAGAVDSTTKVVSGSITASAASVTTFTTTSTNPLSGTYSLNTASSGAWSVGQGFISQAYSIDREDYVSPKVMAFSARYEVVSGSTNLNMSGTTSNTFAVWLYDVTNSVWKQPVGSYSMVGDGIVQGTVQFDSTCTSFRIAIVAVNASAGAVSINWDDFKVGPQTTAVGAPITDWVSYIPTGSFSNTTYTGKWRRVGDTMEVVAHGVAGGAVVASGGTLAVAIPSGYTIDTSKLLGAGDPTNLGSGRILKSATANYPGSVGYSTTTQVILYNFNAAGTTAVEASTTATVPITFAAGDAFDMIFRVPITGWSSSVQMSSDADTRVVAFNANTPSGTLSAAYNAISWVKLNDSHGAFNGTTTYTVPVSGWYQISASIAIAATFAAGNNNELRLKVNGAARADHNARAGGAQVWATPVLHTLQLLNAGDLLTFESFTDGTGPSYVGTQDFQRLSIHRLSGPAAIAASEKIYASYYQNSAQSITAATQTVVNFDTKIEDSHGAVTTGASWKFMAPRADKYRLSVVVTSGNNAWTATQSFAVAFFKNGSAYTGSPQLTAVAQATATFRLIATGSHTFSLLAGEYLDIRLTQSLTANLFNGSGVFISIESI
jgi:hypothetical protein